MTEECNERNDFHIFIAHYLKVLTNRTYWLSQCTVVTLEVLTSFSNERTALCTVAKNVTEVSNQMFESGFQVKSQWDLSILLSSLAAWMTVSRGTYIFSLASMFALTLICLRSYNIHRFARPVILEDCILLFG